MAYKPLKVSVRQERTLEEISTGWLKWLNLLVDPQLQDKKTAQSVVNLLIDWDWNLEKRKWYSIDEDFSWLWSAIWMYEIFDENIVIFSIDNKVYYHYSPTSTTTLIWTYWTVSDTDFVWVKYWDYFFFTNWTGKIQYVTYDFSSTNLIDAATWTLNDFALNPWNQNLVWNWADSSWDASTTIAVTPWTYYKFQYQYSNLSSYTMLTLRWTWAFWTIDDSALWTQDPQTLFKPAETTSLDLLATTTWASLNWFQVDWIGIFERLDDTLTDWELTSSPNKAKVLFVQDWRLFAWNTDSDASQVIWAEQDLWGWVWDVPFTNWTVPVSDPLPTDPWQFYNRPAWGVKEFAWNGDQVITFYESGKSWFRIINREFASQLVQDVEFDFQRLDFWWERWAINLNEWVFYLNESWLWQFAYWLNNQTQETNISRILWESFVANIDFTDSDMIFDNVRNIILISCSKKDTWERMILWYHLENQAWGQIKGVTVKNFIKIENEIFAWSTSEWKTYKLFDTYSDNWVNIETEFSQEIPLSLDSLYRLNWTTIKWEFETDAVAKFAFDIYEKNGTFNRGRLEYQITTNWITDLLTKEDWDWLLLEDWDSFWLEWAWTEQIRIKEQTYIDEFSRIIVRITSNDTKFHKINWISLQTQVKWTNYKTWNVTKL